MISWTFGSFQLIILSVLALVLGKAVTIVFRGHLKDLLMVHCGKSLDTQNNNRSLDDQNVVGTFSVVCKTPLRFVRFRMTGLTSVSGNQLCLSGLELFGTLTGK
jgi:hypothetical protein